MAKDYARTKALEALEATGNNRREASMLMRVWAETDEKLKTALVGPFLNNLCARGATGQYPKSAPGATRPASAPVRRITPLVFCKRSARAGPRPCRVPEIQRLRRALAARHKQAVSLLAAAFKNQQKIQVSRFIVHARICPKITGSIAVDVIFFIIGRFWTEPPEGHKTHRDHKGDDHPFHQHPVPAGWHPFRPDPVGYRQVNLCLREPVRPALWAERKYGYHQPVQAG